MRLGTVIIFVLVFCCQGFAQKYVLEQDVNKDTIIPKFGYKRTYDMANYLGFASMCGPALNTPPSDIEYLKSWQFREGIWVRRKLNKCFAIGSSIEYAREAYRLSTPIISDTADHLKTLWTKQVNNNLVLSVFTRINLNSEKLFLDMGAYYAYDCSPTIITKIESKSNTFASKKTRYHKPEIMRRHQYGIDFKVTYKMIGLYGRYRMSGLYTNQSYDLPKLMIGLLIDYRE